MIPPGWESIRDALGALTADDFDNTPSVNMSGLMAKMERGGTVAVIDQPEPDDEPDDELGEISGTVKAAGELSERIAVRHKEAAASIWIGTFHRFGLDIIRRFHERLNLPETVRLIDRSEAIEFLEEEYPRLQLKHFKNLWETSRPLGDILNAISRANDEVVDSTKYRELALAMLASATSDEDRHLAEKSLEVATVFAAYEQLKSSNGCVDFGDLVAMPVRLCESSPDVQEHLFQIYQHILVDEYQDVNRASVRLLKAISGDGRNLWGPSAT